MLHDDFLGALPIERNISGQHLVENDAESIDVDLAPVVSFADFRRHVMKRANTLRLTASSAARNEFGESVVADFDAAVIFKDVSRLKIAMDDSVVVQIGCASRKAAEPAMHVFDRHALRMLFDDVLKARAGDVFHDDPGLFLFVIFNVEERDEILMFEIEALANAAQLNIEIALNAFECDFLTGVARGEIDFAESADAYATFNGVTIKRCESHWDRRTYYLQDEVVQRLPRWRLRLGGVTPRESRRHFRRERLPRFVRGATLARSSLETWFFRDGLARVLLARDLKTQEQSLRLRSR